MHSIDFQNSPRRENMLRNWPSVSTQQLSPTVLTFHNSSASGMPYLSIATSLEFCPSFFLLLERIDSGLWVTEPAAEIDVFLFVGVRAPGKAEILQTKLMVRECASSILRRSRTTCWTFFQMSDNVSTFGFELLTKYYRWSFLSKNFGFPFSMKYVSGNKT